MSVLAPFYGATLWTSVCVWQSHSSISHVAYLHAQRAEFHSCLSHAQKLIDCAVRESNFEGTGIGKVSGVWTIFSDFVQEVWFLRDDPFLQS